MTVHPAPTLARPYPAVTMPHATTDGDHLALPAAPDDSRSQRGEQVWPVVVMMEEVERLRCAFSQIIALADKAPGLTDEQLRERLLALVDKARPGAVNKITRHSAGSPSVDGMSRPCTGPQRSPVQGGGPVRRR